MPFSSLATTSFTTVRVKGEGLLADIIHWVDRRTCALFSTIHSRGRTTRSAEPAPVEPEKLIVKGLLLLEPSSALLVKAESSLMSMGHVRTFWPCALIYRGTLPSEALRVLLHLLLRNQSLTIKAGPLSLSLTQIQRSSSLSLKNGFEAPQSPAITSDLQVFFF